MTPFLLLPRYILNADGDGVVVDGRTRPDTIADYYSGAVNPNLTVVVLHGNSSFLIEMPIGEFDNMLKLYYKYIDKHKHSLPLIITPEDLSSRK
jgi:hypothetical protein